MAPFVVEKLQADQLDNSLDGSMIVELVEERMAVMGLVMYLLNNESWAMAFEDMDSID